MSVQSSRRMANRKFVFPQYQPQKSNRWQFNKLNYDGINDVLYIEPLQIKKVEVLPKVQTFLPSWIKCGSWNFRLTVAVVLFCSIGCFYSIWTLSESYFNYEQSTNIVISVKKELKMTALSACLFYPPLLNQSHPLYKFLRTKDTLKIQDTEQKLTLQAIFDMTPEPEEVLTKCSYRVPNEFDLFKGNKSTCDDFFAVSKYYAVQYVCYRFTPKLTAGKDYSFVAVRYSLEAPGLFYQVYMDRTLFENATTVQPSTYNWNGYPKSRFSTVIKNAPKSSMNKKNETLSHIYLSYYKIKNELLPAPFETNCINYRDETPYLEKSDCFDHCLRNLTIRDLNKLPFGTVTRKGIPLKFVTSADFKNSTFESLYRSFEKKCSTTACVRNDCHELMYVTTFIRREWTSSGLVFRVDTPQSPDLITVFEPKRELFEFLIDVFNCFSNWFGWSFMDFTKIAIILERIA